MHKPVTAPMLFVYVKGASGSYCANQIATVIHNDRYHLSFISSGYATLIPVDQVEKIELSLNGQHCVACDGPLSFWPMNDPSYGPSEDGA